MTFLEICQRLRRDARVSGNGPTTVQNQSGQLLKIVQYAQEAYLDIMLKHSNWLFTWSRLQLTTAQGQGDYVDADLVDLEGLSTVNRRNIDALSWLFYKQSDGVSTQNNLPFTEYNDWRTQYGAGWDGADQGPPATVTIMPNRKIRVTPVPNADTHILKAEYYRRSVTPTQNDSEILIPDDFQKLIVDRGLMLWGEHEDDPTAFQTGKERWGKLYPQLSREYLPPMQGAPPLA